MTLLCLVPGPTKVLDARYEGMRWCFGCRARLPHVGFVVCDEGPSYYDPVYVVECERCHKDRTEFPGREW